MQWVHPKDYIVTEILSEKMDGKGLNRDTHIKIFAFSLYSVLKKKKKT